MLRPHSQTYLEIFALKTWSENRMKILQANFYVPAGEKKALIRM